MSPRRRVLLSALSPAFLFIAAFAAPAYAQFYDVARGSLGFSLDAIERSPRLLGMGRMTFVGDDPHTAITLWDFAASPLGILEADSAQQIEGIFSGGPVCAANFVVYQHIGSGWLGTGPEA